MPYTQPIPDLIRKRYSCRNYLDKPIAADTQKQLVNFIALNSTTPFNTELRFTLVAATEQDRSSLRSLGTYGFIQGAPAFIIGAMSDSPKNLEDFGFMMEKIVLYAAELGLGTCWLGGSFTRSSFEKKISIHDGESMPAVCSIGYPANADPFTDTVISQVAKPRSRLPWEVLFFDNQFGVPLSPETAGVYTEPLEMVRLGPSASNKQPWRIVHKDNAWHFYLQRSKNYRDSLIQKLLNIADIQRIDMGIATSHFELEVNELGLSGKWGLADPGIEKPDKLTEYTVSWLS